MNETPPPDPSGPARRRLLIGAVAGSAALAGFGIAWWNGDVTEGRAAEKAPFWQLTFETPQGVMLPMQSFSGKPLLLNFWATWCPPCIDEMPLLDRFYAENATNGWQVLGLAVDKLPSVVQFLKQTPIRFPIALAGMAGADLSRSLGNSNGGLPFTVVFDAGGSIAHRKMGRVTEQDLQQWRAAI